MKSPKRLRMIPHFLSGVLEILRQALFLITQTDRSILYEKSELSVGGTCFSYACDDSRSSASAGIGSCCCRYAIHEDAKKLRRFSLPCTETLDSMQKSEKTDGASYPWEFSLVGQGSRMNRKNKPRSVCFGAFSLMLL